MSERLEQTLDTIETALSASMDESEKKEARIAAVSKLASEMSDDERKEARKAFDDGPDEDSDKEGKKSRKARAAKAATKSAMEDGDDEDKSGRKASTKVAMDHEKDEMKKKIASLTASLNIMQSKPLINEMLSARATAGMKQDALEKFEKSFYGQSLDQIKQRYSEDKPLFSKFMSASVPTAAAPTEKALVASYDGATDPSFDTKLGGALSASGETETTLEELWK